MYLKPNKQQYNNLKALISYEVAQVALGICCFVSSVSFTDQLIVAKEKVACQQFIQY